MKESAKPYKTKPSVWPKWIFIGLRVVQVAFACIPMSMASWFIWALKEAGYGVPWQFSIIAAVAALTIINSAVTAYLVFAQTLAPIIVMGVDSGLIALWTLAWAGLAGGMKKNLAQTCSKKYWGDSVGVRVCMSYKNSFAFAILTSIALAGTIFLATRVRTAKTRAKYAAMRASVGSTIMLKPTNVPDNDTSYPDGTMKTFATNTSNRTSNPFVGGTYRNSTLTIGSNPFAGGTMRSTMTGGGHSRNPSQLDPEFTYAAPVSPSAAEVESPEAAVKAQEAGTGYAGYNDPLGQEEPPASLPPPSVPPPAVPLVDIEERKIG